jgi:hypothetical protein
MKNYEDAKRAALKLGFRVEELSEVCNQKKLLKITCGKGHERIQPKGHFTSRFKGCLECQKEAPLELGEFLTDPRTKNRISQGYSVLGVKKEKQEVCFFVKCPQGHGYWVARWRFNQGVGCGTCDGKNKSVTLSTLKKDVEAAGWKILSTDYSDQYQKLEFQDPQGAILQMSADSWKRGHRSVRGPVRQVRNRDIKDVKKEFKTEGYTLHAETFVNTKTPMLTTCPVGHEFYIHYNHWKNGVRCSVCHGTPTWTLEEIQKDPIYSEQGFWVLGLVKRRNKIHVRLACAEQGHEMSPIQPSIFKARAISRNLRCPSCYPQASNAELNLLAEIQKLYPDAQKKKIAGIEYDVFSESGKFAIEYCGLYYHSEAMIDPEKKFLCRLTGKEKNKLIFYHQYKYEVLKTERPDIKLFTVFEDEWVNKKDIVLNRILKKERVSARDTEFSKIGQAVAQDFLRKNHLQGPAPVSHHLCFGLSYQKTLIGVITFGDHHRAGHEDEIVLSRMCFGDLHVIGGSEKLFKNSLPHLPPGKKVISWSDNRYSQGEVYRRLGFRAAQELRPDYSYCKSGDNPLRISKQAMKKTPAERLTNKTEHELRLEQGWFRIWDCGKIRWVLDIPN